MWRPCPTPTAPRCSASVLLLGRHRMDRLMPPLRLQRAVVGAAVALLAALALGSPLAAQEAGEPIAAQLAQPSALEAINAYRARAGVAPAAAHSALMQSAANHVAYYDLNRGDSALAAMGLHDDPAGAGGLTGASMAQ